MAEHKFPNITNITPLLSASEVNQFDINWEYNFGQPDVSFKVYRFVGEFPNNPAISPPINNANWALIATLAPTELSYQDTLTDLNLNGFTFSNGNWVDSNNNNVLEQVFKTNRKLYYKVIAINNTSLQFNSLPFVFVAYGQNLSCKSTITQVKFNKLYEEGEDIWYRTPTDMGIDTGYTINCISVDANFADRQGLVWFTANSGSTGKVVVIDIATGGDNFKQEYNFSFPVYGIRVDPTNGDAIVTGKTSSLIRCQLAVNGSYQQIGLTTKALGTYGGNAITLKNTGTEIIAQTIWDRHYVLNWNITTPGAATLIDPVNYGDVVTTQDNNFGITTGPDQTYFVNGHEKVIINWSETVWVYP